MFIEFLYKKKIKIIEGPITIKKWCMLVAKGKTKKLNF